MEIPTLQARLERQRETILEYTDYCASFKKENFNLHQRISGLLAESRRQTRTIHDLECELFAVKSIVKFYKRTTDLADQVGFTIGKRE